MDRIAYQNSICKHRVDQQQSVSDRYFNECQSTNMCNYDHYIRSLTGYDPHTFNTSQHVSPMSLHPDLPQGYSPFDYSTPTPDKCPPNNSFPNAPLPNATFPNVPLPNAICPNTSFPNSINFVNQRQSNFNGIERYGVCTRNNIHAMSQREEQRNQGEPQYTMIKNNFFSKTYNGKTNNYPK